MQSLLYYLQLVAAYKAARRKLHHGILLGHAAPFSPSIYLCTIYLWSARYRTCCPSLRRWSAGALGEREAAGQVAASSWIIPNARELLAQSRGPRRVCPAGLSRCLPLPGLRPPEAAAPVRWCAQPPATARRHTELGRTPVGPSGSVFGPRSEIQSGHDHPTALLLF
jgi:hypothetical protein